MDDTPENLRVLGQMLDEAGYEVMIATNGQDALANTHATPSPDLILLDIMMPGMDGYEVCRRLKNDPKIAAIPVIFLTALDDHDTIVKAFQAGAADFVIKPFNGLEVLARVKTHAELNRGRIKLQNYARQLKDKLDRTEADEEAGRQVQFKLLPPNAAYLSQCIFQRMYRPSLRMSGDFVDYFVIDDQRTGFYMLDVAGHGAASAFITVLIKSSISRAQSDYQTGTNDTICDPARLLTHLNQELIQGGLDKHAAIFYAVLENNSRNLNYANGGWFPFPILFSNGTVQSISSRSKPIGLFNAGNYTTRTLSLPEAYTLTIMSDGVLDIIPEEALLAKVARIEAIAQNGLTDPEDIRRALKIDEVGELPDDITLLTITRKAS